MPKLRYRWQLTVIVPGGQLIQWEGNSHNVPETTSHDELTHEIFQSWLETPNGRQFGRTRGISYRLFAVKL